MAKYREELEEAEKEKAKALRYIPGNMQPQLKLRKEKYTSKKQ